MYQEFLAPFRESVGRPRRRAPLRLPDQPAWKEILRHVGAGKFLEGFLSLFPAGERDLRRCLEAWDFLVPPSPDRVVLGHNAHGILVVLEQAHAPGARIFLLDPIRLRYRDDGPILSWFRRPAPPDLLEDGLFRAWPGRLERGEILAQKVPSAIRGAWSLANFQVEPIVRYYESMAPILRKVVRRPARIPKREPPGPWNLPPQEIEGHRCATPGEFRALLRWLFGTSWGNPTPADLGLPKSERWEEPYRRLRSTPYGEIYSRAMADLLTDEDGQIREMALHFFQRFPEAEGASRLSEIVRGPERERWFRGKPGVVTGDLEPELILTLGRCARAGRPEAIAAARRETRYPDLLPRSMIGPRRKSP